MYKTFFFYIYKSVKISIQNQYINFYLNVIYFLYKCLVVMKMLQCKYIIYIYYNSTKIYFFLMKTNIWTKCIEWNMTWTCSWDLHYEPELHWTDPNQSLLVNITIHAHQRKDS